jgi:hypothetical protein
VQRVSSVCSTDDSGLVSWVGIFMASHDSLVDLGLIFSLAFVLGKKNHVEGFHSRVVLELGLLFLCIHIHLCTLDSMILFSNVDLTLDSGLIFPNIIHLILFFYYAYLAIFYGVK